MPDRMSPLTLVEMLSEAPAGTGIRFVGGGRDEPLSYRDLFQEALCALGGLQQAGVRPGDEVVIAVRSNRDFLTLFWACVIGGLSAVPTSVPVGEEHVLRLAGILEVLRRPTVVADKHLQERLPRLADGATSAVRRCAYRKIIWDAVPRTSPGKPAAVRRDQIAYLQFSSGSTGRPKGVCLTHADVCANVGAIGRVFRTNAADVVLNWLPLSHDMGLVVCHLHPLWAGAAQVHLPTTLFIRRPTMWFEATQQHTASILASPNFGLQYVLRYLERRRDPVHYDLSRVRTVVIGAEPISAAICKRFEAFAATHGMPPTALRPSYGLAEATVGVATTRLDARMHSIEIDRTKLSIGGAVHRLPSGDGVGTRLVAVGRPIPGVAVQVRNDHDDVLLTDHLGHIVIRGGGVAAGYYADDDATRAARTDDGWFRTGDIGFFHDGQLFIAGRQKEVIIVRGTKIFPPDVERVVAAAPEIGEGTVAACGVPDEASGTEGIVVFVRFRGDTADFQRVARQVRERVADGFGVLPHAVVPIRSLPRTTAGKVRRLFLAERFAAGDFG